MGKNLSLLLLLGTVALASPASADGDDTAAAQPSAPQGAAALDLDALHGKVVYLDFWASWCAPCVKSLPWLTRLQDRLGEKGLVVVGVNLDRDRKAADAFLKKHPASFRVVYDPEGELAKRWDIEVMPSSFVLDRDGKVRSDHQGFRDGDAARIETEIEALLAEPPRHEAGS